MPTLTETQSLTVLAKHLYAFLPASGAKYTFREAAADAGVADMWTGVAQQSKLPAITALLTAVWDCRRGKFCDLIEQIVKGSLGYRVRRGDPLTRAEVDELNRLVASLRFKIPSLCDPAFLESLPGGLEGPRPAPQQESSGPPRVDERADPNLLRVLKDSFVESSRLTDRQAAGLQLEQLLTRLFGVYGLVPEAAFRVQGEQIDGAFTLDAEPYLLEAKWTRDPVPAEPIFSFCMKVEGKSHFTRGVFLSVNGFSSNAVPALVRGKAQRIVLMDGAHLHRVLDGAVALDDLLRRLVHRLATRGEPYWSVSAIGTET